MALSFAARMVRALLRPLIKSRSVSVDQLRQQDARSAPYTHRVRPGVRVLPWSSGSVSGWQAVPDLQRSETPWIHLHGGGYVIGGLDSHQTLLQLMALTLGRTVIFPVYRLAPEAPFPAALEDALLAALAVNDESWVLSGDSAGGGLALSVVQALRDRGSRLPEALILLSPWVDLTNSSDSHRRLAREEVLLTTATLQEWARHYAAGTNLADPRISPLFGDFRGLPPLLIQVGSHEILLDDATRLQVRAREAGCEATLSVWEGLWHVWPVLGDILPETGLALEEIVRFIDGPPTASLTSK